jgi:hypothetical protein
VSKKHKRRRRETDLENPVCPGCRSPQDLVDVTDDNSGLLECTFCDIRFFIEEINDPPEEDTDGVVDTRAGSGGGVRVVSVEGESNLPRAPVLGEITDLTGASHG